MKVDIITIGDEILIGQIVDTNSAWMAEILSSEGLEIRQISSVSDTKDHIVRAIDEGLQHSDAVLVTGGLGPTKDDITKTALSAYFGGEMIFSEEADRGMREYLSGRNIHINKQNESQSWAPSSAEIITNRCGTAPIMKFRKGEKLLWSMPGVPSEMKSAVLNDILPELLKNRVGQHLSFRTVYSFGLPEAALANRLEDFENSMPENMKLAYLPSPGKIRLRLSILGEDKSRNLEILEQKIEEIQSVLGDILYSVDKENMQEVVGDLLAANGKTLATAESCTGGYIAHLLTGIPGSSNYFKGGVVTYSNESKENILGVRHESLVEFGAVSEQVVAEMAEGARIKLNADFGVATSGIAGPTGGTDEKPVGTVWIGVSSEKGTKCRKFQYGKFRDRNIVISSVAALNLLRLELLNNGN